MLTFHFSDNIIIDKADKTIDTTHSLSRMPTADGEIHITLNETKWPWRKEHLLVSSFQNTSV